MKEKKAKRPWSRRKKIVTAVVTVLAAALLVLAVKWVPILYNTWRALHAMSNTGDAGSLTGEVVATPEAYKGDVINLLVVGIDYDSEDTQRDYGSPEEAKTDVILYINYRVKDGKVNVLQIPRDSYVGLDKSGTGKINSVFSDGADRTNPISNLAKVINDEFGLPVDSFIWVDMASFKEIVDTWGGIDMYVPWDVYNDENELIVKQGNARILGTDAESILRQRKNYGQGDLKRLELQQYFYAAMFRELTSMTVTDLSHMLPIITYRVKSDLSASTIFSLAISALNLKGGDVYVVRAPGGSITWDAGKAGNQSGYGINSTNLATLLNEHFLEADMQVKASDLKVPSGFTYTLGEIFDQGRTMETVMADSGSSSSDSSAASSGGSAASSGSGSSAAQSSSPAA